MLPVSAVTVVQASLPAQRAHWAVSVEIPSWSVHAGLPPCQIVLLWTYGTGKSGPLPTTQTMTVPSWSIPVSRPRGFRNVDI